MTESSGRPGGNIPIRTLPNLRDLGGWPAAGDRVVATGRVFRSVELGRLDDADLPAVRDLGLKTIFDFRSVPEREASPDRDVGAREVPLDVMADRDDDGPLALLGKTGDTGAIREALADGRAATLMREAYLGLVTMPSALRSYSTFFTELAAGADLPALFHCTTGKDRTGWAAASLLLFLGVSERDVFSDYLATNEQLLPALEPLFAKAGKQGLTEDLLRPVLGVDRSYLQTALDEMESGFGDIGGYFSEGLGLADETLSALTERLLKQP